MLKVEDLKRKRFGLDKNIELIEKSKDETLDDKEKLELKVAELEQKISTLSSARQDVDLTIQNTEEAVKKIKANIDLLLAMVDKSDQELKGVFKT